MCHENKIQLHIFFLVMIHSCLAFFLQFADSNFIFVVFTILKLFKMKKVPY